MEIHDLVPLLNRLISLAHETEWVEFKHNNINSEEIGEYLSALSNSAALHGEQTAYLVWGIQDEAHSIVGTNFKPRAEKIGNQELENWLATQVSPRINFKIHEFLVESKNIVLLEIPKASNIPVRFKNTEFIRVGSYKRLLKDFPEKERELWALFSREPFEKGIALTNLTADQVLTQINYPAYFDATKRSLPDNRAGILARLSSESLIVKTAGNHFNITNLGGILFAKELRAFESLSRKAVRVIIYQGSNRIQTQREQTGSKGYAVGFERIIGFINDHIPQNEQIGQAFRQEVRMYPEIAIRELVANAIIHQDFNMSGTGPMIEIFADRIEITNPGIPLIDTMRFIDEPPQSRNEALAAFMRRINVCEERGSGIDKVINSVEIFQLPAPEFIVTGEHTKVILFAYKKLADMSKEDRVRACYQHACLRYVSNEKMTNSSLRTRFSIESKNYAIASRIIGDTVDAGFVKPYDPDSTSKKHAKYVPFWA